MQTIRKTIITGLILFLLMASSSAQQKQEEPLTRILFIFDVSYSMIGYWGNEQKIDIARNILINIVDSLEKVDNVQMALRVYGSQSPVSRHDCKDTKLEVPFRDKNAVAIRQKLRFLKPNGYTPIAYTLMQSARDFPACNNCRNIIILLTDGKEECEGDPCKASNYLQKQGIVLRPFVIGIGLDEHFKESFQCVGKYYNATNRVEFYDLLHVVITQILHPTTVQVNLLDIEGNPTETDVNMTFYDLVSDQIRYNYIHTINNRGEPDSINIDPLLPYRMKVHTIPPVYIDSIALKEGQHNIIAVNSPRGTLQVKTSGTSIYQGLKFSVRDRKTNEIVNFQRLNESEAYLVGAYDIDIPVLPSIQLEDIKIKQNYTTTIEIPRAGLVNLLYNTSGTGSLYVMEGNDMRWIHNIQPNKTREALNLLPGTYQVVFKPINARESAYTTVRKFDIKSGGAVTIQF
jgi:Ca-activated chloride channel homolog